MPWTRTRSSHELLSNVRRARKFAEHYEIDQSDPRGYMNQTNEQRTDWNSLLDQIK